jgi:hypothetical protein
MEHTVNVEKEKKNIYAIDDSRTEIKENKKTKYPLKYPNNLAKTVVLNSKLCAFIFHVEIYATSSQLNIVHSKERSGMISRRHHSTRNSLKKKN